LLFWLMKKISGVICLLFVLVFSLGVVSAYANPPVYIKWDDGCPAANSCGGVIPDANANPERYVVASCSNDDCCCWCDTGYVPSGGKCYPAGEAPNNGGSDHSGDIDSATLIESGVFGGHIAEDGRVGYYKIDLVGPSKLTFLFDVSTAGDDITVGFEELKIIAADMATSEFREWPFSTNTGDRLTTGYTTLIGGVHYIKLMARHDLLDYNMDLDITCVENALSDDGLKKCVGEEWINLTGEVTSAGETIDEALLIDEGTYTGYISEDKGFNYYKVDLVGTSRLDFLFDVSTTGDDITVGFEEVKIIAADMATSEFREWPFSTNTGDRLTTGYTTLIGGVHYIKLQARNDLLDYNMDLDISCVDEGNLSDDRSMRCADGEWVNLTCVENATSDDGLQQCIGEEWVNLTDDGEVGEVILDEVLGDDGGVSEVSCPGCMLDEKCYTMGYRKSGEYCSDGLEFISQLGGEEVCENNFECESNVCVGGECVSVGFMRKILNWFKGLFGG
jgi:hypothetical protein